MLIHLSVCPLKLMQVSVCRNIPLHWNRMHLKLDILAGMFITWSVHTVYTFFTGVHTPARFWASVYESSSSGEIYPAYGNPIVYSCQLNWSVHLQILPDTFPSEYDAKVNGENVKRVDGTRILRWKSKTLDSIFFRFPDARLATERIMRPICPY